MYEMCSVKAEWPSNYNGNHTVFSCWLEGGKQKHKKEGLDFSSQKHFLFASVCHTRVRRAVALVARNRKRNIKKWNSRCSINREK